MLAESVQALGASPNLNAEKKSQNTPAMVAMPAQDYFLEIRSLESLTQSERSEANQEFAMDWTEYDPNHPSYDSQRLEDVVILAKDNANGRMIGFAYGKRMLTGLWWLNAFLVVAERQGRGIGTRLVQQLIEYIVKERQGKAFFSTTQVHRIASIKAQRNAYDQLFENGASPPHGIGYYHFRSSDHQDLRDETPSAVVLFPLVQRITRGEFSQWTQFIRETCLRFAGRYPSNFYEFLQTEGYTSDFRSDDPIMILSGILQGEGCPADFAGDLASKILPMIDSLDGDATHAAFNTQVPHEQLA
jgi:GNAT superfamily N-acetyltransferase